jgi:microcystin degradation protein MlrC
MTRKLAVFRLVHETNSFSIDPGDKPRFQECEWGHGLAAAELHRGTDTEIGAVFDFLAVHRDWQASFFRMASANPCGDIPVAFFEEIRDELLADLAGTDWDAIFLSLHGAAAMAGGRSCELDLVRAIRERFPKVPLAVTMDLHANIDPALIGLVDISVGYKTHPHVDMRVVAGDALRHLLAMVRGEVRPTAAIAKLPLLLPSVNMRTTGDGPMRDIVAQAQLRAAQEGALDITVYGGFPYGDCTMAGACVTVLTDNDQALADRLADELGGFLWDNRARFFRQVPSMAAVLATLSDETAFPVAIVDNADNPGSGGGGDTPGQLRSLLAADLPWKSAFCFLHDPALVAQARAAGVGATIHARMGGWKTPAYGPPVEAEVEVVRLVDDCTYNNVGPQNHGLVSHHGATAVLRRGNVSIVVTAICAGISDPAFYAMHGIDFADTLILAGKAKNHFRAAMAPVFARIVDVDEPGPAAYDFTHLPFRHVPPHLYRELCPS